MYTALHPGFGKHKKQSLALCLRILTGVQRSMLLKPPECDKHVHALIAALVSIAGDNVREFSECLVLFPHLVWITLELLHLYMTRRMTTIRNDPGARERAERICDTALQLLDVAFARDTIADTVSEERFLELLNITRPPGHHAEADRAMGFCFLNNAALAAVYALESREIDQIDSVTLR